MLLHLLGWDPDDASSADAAEQQQLLDGTQQR